MGAKVFSPFQTLVGFPSAASLCSPRPPPGTRGPSLPLACPLPHHVSPSKPCLSLFLLTLNAQHLPGGGSDVGLTTGVERERGWMNEPGDRMSNRTLSVVLGLQPKPQGWT